MYVKTVRADAVTEHHIAVQRSKRLELVPGFLSISDLSAVGAYMNHFQCGCRELLFHKTSSGIPGP